MAEHQLPKLTVRVRFPSPAPKISLVSELIAIEVTSLWATRLLWPRPPLARFPVRTACRLTVVLRQPRLQGGEVGLPPACG